MNDFIRSDGQGLVAKMKLSQEIMCVDELDTRPYHMAHHSAVCGLTGVPTLLDALSAVRDAS